MRFVAHSTSSERGNLSPVALLRGKARCAFGAQPGFALIELIIALAIIGIVAAGVVGSVYQLLTASKQANDQQYVTTQLRNAELWISRDAMMAVRLTQTGFPLTFAWDIVDGTPEVVVTYYLDATASGSRLRREVNRVGDLETVIVAEGINADESSYLYTPYELTVTLSATSGSHTDTCTFEVQPRTTAVEIMT